MLGAIYGDVVGSPYERWNTKSKSFPWLREQCMPTDDSNMTLAVAQAILRADGDWTALPELTVASMKELYRDHPLGYGGRFIVWLNKTNPRPYGSWGNGAAMRVSPCAWAAKTMDEALMLSDLVTGISHNHPEGLKGARAITAAVWLARHGSTKQAIRQHIEDNYYPLNFTLDEIRPAYCFDVSCQGSVPQAIEAFLESTDFEDAIRNAVSIGGDSDTIAAMAGSIAEPFYGITAGQREMVLPFLDAQQTAILNAFEERYGR